MGNNNPTCKSSNLKVKVLPLTNLSAFFLCVQELDRLLYYPFKGVSFFFSRSVAPIGRTWTLWKIVFFVMHSTV